MFRIVYEKHIEKDIKYLKAAKLDEKARNLIEVLRVNPYQKPPSYEKLVGNLSGYLSRRINIQHRLVYQVYEEAVTIGDVTYEGTVKIISMWSHYEGFRML